MPYVRADGATATDARRAKVAKERLLTFFTVASEKIEARPLPGRYKAWIWDKYVTHKVAWLFLIHDIAPSFIEKELQPIQTRWLRRWLGFPRRGTNTSIFYRTRENHGLQLKETLAWHKECRLIRRHILSKSKDPQVLAIHEAVSKEQHKSKSNAWKDCVELKKLNDVALFEKMRGPLKEG